MRTPSTRKSGSIPLIETPEDAAEKIIDHLRANGILDP